MRLGRQYPMSSTATPASATNGGRPFDTAARGALLLSIASGILWLVLGGALSLIHSVQLHSVSFFTACEWFTFGRVQGASEAALLFGWAGNAGIAVTLWLLGRLGGANPRGLGFSTLGSVLWNLGVTASVVGILMGEGSGHASLPVPPAVLPILILGAAAVSVTGILAWSDRRQRVAYASQWYAAAALFSLPWLLSAGFVGLHLVGGQGLASLVAGAWAGQGLLNLWLSAIVVAILYYVIPRLSGREVDSYQVSVGGFWALVVFAPFAATRGFSGGPFPVWIPSLGIAAGILALIHYVIVGVNLRQVIGVLRGSAVAKFFAIALVSYVLGGFWDLATSLRFVAKWTQFTYVADARWMLLVMGAFTPAVLGGIYFLVPRLTGKPWASDVLITQHLRITFVSVLFLVGGLLVAGLTQALLLADKESSFLSMIEALKPGLLFASGGIVLVLLGAFHLLVNLGIQLKPECSCCCSCESANSDVKAS